MKQCTKCKQLKPVEQFVSRPHRLDGRSSQCRECERKIVDKRNQEIKNRKQYEL